ncbi:MAG: YbfB/YjiJ family MFS transporter [Xanthomonadaceae bacterium]|nr:YbfB/YjiJ family MFS transporter [Xanthomonadaceae bacterium]
MQQATSAPARPRPPAWLMIGTGIFVVVVTLVFGRLAYGLILPPMRDGLGLSYQQAGTLGTVTALGYVCLVMVAGAFAGRFGGQLSVLLGVLLTVAGFTGLSLASDYYLIMVLMLVLGCGTAFAYTPLVSLLATWFPQRRGAVIGLLSSGVGIGMVWAGMMVPYFTELFGSQGWRYVWGLFAAVGVVVAIGVVAFLRNPPLPVGANGEGPRPVDKAAVYRNRRLLIVGLVYGVIGLTYIVQSVFMYSYAVDSGIPPLTAGRLAAMTGLLGIFASPTWGSLSDRIGRGNALVLSMSLALLATAVPIIQPTLFGFTFHYAVLGCTVSGMFTSVLAAATEQVEAREAPLAVSFVTVFFAVGQLLGPAIAGMIVDWTGEFRTMFMFTCSVMAIGVYLCWLVRGFSRPRRAAAGCGDRCSGTAS